MTILGITCQRDDGPYLAEWIAHHFAAGFARMLVLSHDCADGSDHLLDVLAQDARIAHVPFQPKGRKSVQWQALKAAQDHPWTAQADWVLFFDCDEFVCLPAGLGLPQHLMAVQAHSGSFDAMALPWRLFGSGGHITRTPGLTPERFTRAAPRDLYFPFAHLFKTLHRPEAFRQLGVHRPRAKPSKPARWCGPQGDPLPPGFAGSDAAISLYGLGQTEGPVCLHHYSLRSVEEFMIKRVRGLPNHQSREIGLTYWAERNWNSEQAEEILPMMPQTHAELDRLMQLPGAAQAQSNCLAWHSARYAQVLGDIDELRLQFRLGFLDGSAPPSAEAGRAFLAAQTALLRNTEGKP